MKSRKTTLISAPVETATDHSDDTPTQTIELGPPGRVAAIVGRPNVGKSSLFNRMAQLKIAIVHDQPGITRDRLVAECRLGSEEPFEIIDTGGIGAQVDGVFSRRVQAEAEIALEAAAVILFVVDGRSGLTPVDQELARRLRRADRPVLLVINKIDVDKHVAFESDFASLGFPETYGVSAAHGRGIGPLVAAVERHLRYAAAANGQEEGEEKGTRPAQTEDARRTRHSEASPRWTPQCRQKLADQRLSR